jgi:acyl dehydratase
MQYLRRRCKIIHRNYNTTSYLSCKNDKFNIIGTLIDNGIKIGSYSEVKHIFTQENVNIFANICGDNNPLHINPSFAKDTMFKGTIVHGIFVSSLFSTLFGRSIIGSVYVSQTLQFKKPVHVGKEITARMKIITIDEKKIGSFLTCSTICELDGGIIAVEGEAKVLLPKK